MPLPLASVEKLIRKGAAYRISEGAAYRISKGAARELAAHLEALAIDIAKEAIMLADHAGRKTVKAEDVKLAEKRLF